MIMSWLAAVLLLGVTGVCLSQEDGICVELLSSSPTLVGEDATFQCPLRDAIAIGWRFNGTFLPSPLYNTTLSRGTIYEILTVPAELRYNMSEVECGPGVPGQQWSEDCVPVYLIVKEPDDANSSSLAPTDTPTSEGPSTVPDDANSSSLAPTDTPTSEAPSTGNESSSAPPDVTLPTNNTTGNTTSDSASEEQWIGIIAGACTLASLIVMAVLSLVLSYGLYKYYTCKKQQRQIQPPVYTVPVGSAAEPGNAQSKACLESTCDANSKLELGKTNGSIHDQGLEPGKTNRTVPRSPPHADISRKGDQSGGTEMSDMVVSSFRPETNSVRSPAVLIAEDGTKDEVLPDGVQQLLLKETDAVIPSNTEQGMMVLPSRTE